MRDLGDFDLRHSSPDPPLRSREPAPSATERSAWDEEPSSWNEPVREPAATVSRDRNRAVGVVAALVLAGALVVAFWMMSRRVEPPQPGTAAETERSAESTPATGFEPPRSSDLEAPLPPLDQSDVLVRQLVGALSTQPALTAWLATGNLVRTFAAAVENASLGASPSPNLRFLQPRDPYRVIERDGPDGQELVPDPASYRRYDLVTAVFTSIDPQAAADVYRRLHGLAQEAFAELGYPDRSFDSALAAAFETVLATPIPDTAPLLERHVNSYRYADPRLEELAPLQKHLLRMGPDHARSIKAQVRALARELELGID